MKSILGSLFCCCSRRKDIDAVQDEHSHLLPSVEDRSQIPTYDATTIDHQKAKERLHGIVKSKEGKMVRVLSRVPFNLRNDPMDGPANTSSSRSNRSPSANVSYTYNRSLGHFRGQDMSRRSSSKPSPSVSRSESASSMQQVSVSRFSTTDELDPYLEHKLKVHLIQTVKSNQRAFSRRGRSKTRHSRPAEDGDEQAKAPTLEGIQSVDSGRGDFNVSGYTALGQDEELKSPSGSGVEGHGVTPLSNETNVVYKAISNEISASLKDHFEDVGTLTRSWGD
ncbi:hypothetical protein EW145_g1171 [Phellinidium pouzarii]|uniref:Uncharacterized protein n=1 Tax=Phellinidium pouzarii TaxID=167371 RepID=A0A4S4LFQ1_9AGAM|nr:hypothetical protein EW145_g1171 [Phellinidium pouzarii]